MMKPKQLKPLKALGPIHAKPLYYGAVQADGTGASVQRLRARGLFYCDVAAALGWSEHRVERVVGSLARLRDETLDTGKLTHLVRRQGIGLVHEVQLLEDEQAQLWAYLKTVPETSPSLMIAYYSKADGSYGKLPGTIPFVYYQDKEGRTRHPVDVALAVLNDRYEVIAA